MSNAFGGVLSDKSFSNVNIQQTLGECKTKIRSKCIVSDDIKTQNITTDFVNNVPIENILIESVQVGLSSFRGVQFKTVQYILQPSQIVANVPVGPIYTVPFGKSALLFGGQYLTPFIGTGEYLFTLGPSANPFISLGGQTSVVYPMLQNSPIELAVAVTLGQFSELGNGLFVLPRTIITQPDSPTYITITIMEYEIANVQTLLRQSLAGSIPFFTSPVNNSIAGFNYPPGTFATGAPAKGGFGIMFTQNEGIPPLFVPADISANGIPFIRETLPRYPNSKPVGPLPSFDAGTTLNIITPLGLRVHLWGMYLLDSSV